MATVMYPYDDTGRAATNLVQNETQVLTASNSDPYRYCIPTFAPFYEINFKAVGFDALGNEREMVQGVDYNFSLLYIGATRANGAVVWGAITVINNELQGTVKLTYQCLGGKYSADRDYVVQQIAENNYNPRVVAWDQVTNIQELFPPSNHPMDLDNFTGYRDLIDAIDRLQAAPGDNDELRALIWRHILDHDDPHETRLLLGDYAKKQDITDALIPVNTRIDNANTQIEINVNEIAALKNGIIDDGANFQSQIDSLKTDVSTLNDQFDSIQPKIDATNQRIDTNVQAIAAITPRVSALELAVDDISGKVDVNKAEVEQSIVAINSSIDLTNQQVATLTADTEAQLTSLGQRMTAMESTIGFTLEVPTFKTSEMLLVSSPHLRFMVWNEGLMKYVRAPWNQPGIIVYSYNNPSNGITGYLPIRADMTYNQDSYPDLVALLGLSGGGTFSLAEMRGEFIRVLDNGRGVDVGRELLSYQNSSNRAHYHGVGVTADVGQANVPARAAGGTGSPGSSFLSTGETPDSTIAVDVTIDGAGIIIDSEGEAESKPRSIAVPVWVSI